MFFYDHLQMYKDHLQSSTKIRKIEDKGLPAPPGGSSEKLQHSKIQRYFTLALLVLLVTNIMSVS